MGFEFGNYDLISIDYNQDFVNSRLKLFGNLDLTLRFAQLLGCNLNKSSNDKSIRIRIKVGGKEKEKTISYEFAHKMALKFINVLKNEDPDFSESDWSIIDI